MDENDYLAKVLQEELEGAKKYQMLFDSIDEGFCIIEVIFDSHDKPVDYRFLEVNEAFEKQTGLYDAEGKLMRELRPKHEEHWFEIYGKIALTGKSKRFQNTAKELNRYYDVYAFKIGGEESRKVAILFNDITERKKAEEELRESEKRFHIALRNSPIAVFQQDLNLRYTWVYQPHPHFKKEDLLGKADFEVLDAKSAAKIIAIKERVLSEKIPLQEEVSIIVDGLHYHYILSLEPLYDMEGNLIGLSGASTDITEHKKNEDALKSSQQMLENVLENFPGVVFWKDRNSIYLGCNKNFSSRAGLEPSEIIGKSDFDQELPWKNEAEHYRADDLQVIESGIPKLNIIETLRQSDGHVAWYDTNKIPLRDPDGNIIGVLGTSNDITERKKAEEAIQEEKDKLSSLLESIPDEVWFADANKNLELVNPSVIREFGNDLEGKEVEEIAGKFEVYRPDGTPRPIEEAPPLRALKGEFVKNQGEIVRIPTTGELRHRQVNSVPVKNANEDIIGSISVVRDITELKKIEEDLKGYQADLELKVEERTVQLEESYVSLKENELKLKDAIEELKRSNKELQQFAYITSHDLQEPLRNIASFAQLLQRRYKGKLDADADDFIEFMVEGSIRMKGMIQGLLDYSRIDRSGSEFVKTDMKEMLEKALNNLHLVIEESEAKITHDDLPVVNFGPNQMIRVFQNLIGNAIKFKKPQFPPRIHISAQRKDNEYVFGVEDNGIGMEPQYTDKIFDVFKRLHTLSEYDGTGIGLSIVKKIIESNGGHIWVESELDVGSTFYFTIPIEPVQIGGGQFLKSNKLN